MSKVELRVVKVGVDRGITFAHAQGLLQEKMDKAGLEKPFAGEGFYRSARASHNPHPHPNPNPSPNTGQVVPHLEDLRQPEAEACQPWGGQAAP